MKFTIKNDRAVFEKLCNRCGCLDSDKCPGKGPHFGELKCQGCGAHNGWIPRYDVFVSQMYENSIFAPDTIAEEIVKIEKQIYERNFKDHFAEKSLKKYYDELCKLLAAMPGIDPRHWLNQARIGVN